MVAGAGTGIQVRFLYALRQGWLAPVPPQEPARPTRGCHE